VRVTGAGTADGCDDPAVAVTVDVIGGAVLGSATPVDIAPEAPTSGSVLDWTPSAPPSAVALAMPIDATRPNMVDTPSPAATIRAPTAGWPRRGRAVVGGLRSVIVVSALVFVVFL
jgi:hypothetical protein